MWLLIIKTITRLTLYGFHTYRLFEIVYHYKATRDLIDDSIAMMKTISCHQLRLDRGLTPGRESRSVARQNVLFVTSDFPCLAIRDPQVRLTNQTRLSKSQVTIGELSTRSRDSPLAIRDLGGPKSRVTSGEWQFVTRDLRPLKSQIASDESRVASGELASRDSWSRKCFFDWLI